MSASWTLTGPDGASYQSDRPGTVGGNRRSKLYGRLDCRSALQALARGGYALDRVFFLDEHAAQTARLPAVRGVPARPVRSMDHSPPVAGRDRRSARPSLTDLTCPRHRRAPCRRDRASRRLTACRPNQNCGRLSLSSSGSTRASSASDTAATDAPVSPQSTSPPRRAHQPTATAWIAASRS